MALQRLVAPSAWVITFGLWAVLLASTTILPTLTRVLWHLCVALAVAAATWAALSMVKVVEQLIMRHHRVDVADNLYARTVHTRTQVLGRILSVLILLVGAGAVLLTLPGMRQLGAGLLASAGIAGLIVGAAAQPVVSNLIAGVQLGLTQPLRLDDVVVIEGEWGRIEEVRNTYIVVALWDQRRLIVPLRWLMDRPFQNWTRRTSQVLGAVTLWLDFRTDLAKVRGVFQSLCEASVHWDGRVAVLQVTDSGPWSMEVRLLASAADAAKAFDLRCELREGVLGYLLANQPEALPNLRLQSINQANDAKGGADEPTTSVPRG